MTIYVENVARALYCAEDDGLSWDEEPEILKDEFRRYARLAIALLEEHSERGLSEPLDPGLAEAA